MFKKRKYIKKNLSQKKITSSKDRNSNQQTDRTADLVLACLYDEQHPVSVDLCWEKLNTTAKNRKQLQDILEMQCRNGLVSKDKKGSYLIAANAQIYEASLSQHPKGFGFAESCVSSKGPATFLRDPFISRSRLFSAQHGDRILIRVLRIRNDGRPEATVIKVLERGPELIAGIFERKRQQDFVIPDDPGFPFLIKVVGTSRITPAQGDVVIVRILRDTVHNDLEMPGELVRIVGSAENVDTQMELVVTKYHLPNSFNDDSLRQLQTLPELTEEIRNRLDLRFLAHVTIDGETAKDFDDAVCVEKTDSGYRLYVSIADVSYYVRPGSAVDKEAYERGTSVYFPGRVIPMLPEKLSNDLCSLTPHTDKLTVTAILDYSKTGKLFETSFVRSVIRSQCRFTYTTVAAILTSPQSDEARHNGKFLEQLKWMQDLAQLLLHNKKQRGAVDLNLAEAEIVIDADGMVASLGRLERNFAHQIIEEFMLAANEAVASHFTRRKTPALYRVHEIPNPLKAEDFCAFAQSLGLRLPPFDNVPSWYAAVVEHSKGGNKEYIISNLILRTMQQAHYSPDNRGHFGLSLSDYTHFTSPIRRYPDLMVHRALLVDIAGGSQYDERQDNNNSDLRGQGEHLSQRERTAMNAEREIVDRLKFQYMRHHLHERFSAIISGVTDICLYIEIPKLCVSGAIPIERLQDDYYIFDSKHHRLFGEITAKTYQLGDTLKVQLNDVDIYKRRLNFDIVS